MTAVLRSDHLPSGLVGAHPAEVIRAFQAGGGRFIEVNLGAKGGAFYMRKGGLATETVNPDSAFERESTPGKRPAIDPNALEAAK